MRTKAILVGVCVAAAVGASVSVLAFGGDDVAERAPSGADRGAADASRATTTGAADTSARAPSGAALSLALRQAVTEKRIRAHAAAFQAAARRGGGSRAAGTVGYDGSARYVYEQLEKAGYHVRFQRFPLGAYVERVERARVLEPVRRTLEVDAIDYSPSTRPGGLTAPLAVVPVDADGSHGCESEDFEGRAYRGAVALVRRGECTFADKAENASRAGAVAAIVYADSPTSVFNWAMSPEEATIPAVATSRAVGEALTADARRGDAVVSITVRATTTASSQNVIAETGGAGEHVVMLGGHLDSVDEGPGLNDNGSGCAALLELALQLRKLEPRAKVRFAFWGAEERGLVGSRFYTARLSPEEGKRIAVYLNFDMIGSPNFARFVYRGTRGVSPRAERGGRLVERLFLRHFRARGLPAERFDLGSRSDHASFRSLGVPTGGLFTGSGEIKTAAQARLFGGTAGEPFDPCYHRPCDTLANVDFDVVEEMADAAAHAVATFASSPRLLEAG